MSWKLEVIADNSGEWYGNALCFAGKEEAEKYAHDLECRWFAVRDTRVIEVADAVNSQWINGRGAVALDNVSRADAVE